jgi:hypothetical protein
LSQPHLNDNAKELANSPGLNVWNWRKPPLPSTLAAFRFPPH